MWSRFAPAAARVSRFSKRLRWRARSSRRRSAPRDWRWRPDGSSYRPMTPENLPTPSSRCCATPNGGWRWAMRVAPSSKRTTRGRPSAANSNDFAKRHSHSMHTHQDLPTAVLICHEQDRLDREALASWLASTVKLAGLLLIRDRPGRLWRAARREIRRVGLFRFADVTAFRIYARLFLARKDAAWTARTVRDMRTRYPADLAAIPQVIVTSPNSDAAREFLARVQPDLAIARCKMILKPEVFQLPRV